eukprot:TRINITY_DN4218_c0_g6_i1.p1 TRINITY_DN4218_c0_g6~~TRINITY_DN4218_c0_g6_i1.p1  ORF type:complete len:447 (+),score=48.88 TRINITY_DN4218_c0_g6_i1:127-1467(+)
MFGWATIATAFALLLAFAVAGLYFAWRWRQERQPCAPGLVEVNSNAKELTHILVDLDTTDTPAADTATSAKQLRQLSQSCEGTNGRNPSATATPPLYARRVSAGVVAEDIAPLRTPPSPVQVDWPEDILEAEPHLHMTVTPTKGGRSPATATARGRRRRFGNRATAVDSPVSSESAGKEGPSGAVQANKLDRGDLGSSASPPAETLETPGSSPQDLPASPPLTLEAQSTFSSCLSPNDHLLDSGQQKRSGRRGLVNALNMFSFPVEDPEGAEERAPRSPTAVGRHTQRRHNADRPPSPIFLSVNAQPQRRGSNQRRASMDQREFADHISPSTSSLRHPRRRSRASPAFARAGTDTSLGQPVSPPPRVLSDPLRPATQPEPQPFRRSSQGRSGPCEAADVDRRVSRGRLGGSPEGERPSQRRLTSPTPFALVPAKRRGSVPAKQFEV